MVPPLPAIFRYHCPACGLCTPELMLPLQHTLNGPTIHCYLHPANPTQHPTCSRLCCRCLWTPHASRPSVWAPPSPPMPCLSARVNARPWWSAVASPIYCTSQTRYNCGAYPTCQAQVSMTLPLQLAQSEHMPRLCTAPSPQGRRHFAIAWSIRDSSLLHCNDAPHTQRHGARLSMLS